MANINSNKQEEFFEELEKSEYLLDNYYEKNDLRIIKAKFRKRFSRILKFLSDLNLFYEETNVKTFWGREYQLPLNEKITHKMAGYGILPSPENKLCHFLMKNLNNNEVFFDIGASFGFYTGLVLDFFSDVTVHSFEPSPSTFVYLEKNFDSNSTNLILNNLALSETNGEITFYDFQESSLYAGATLKKSIADLHGRNLEKIKVPSNSLDQYCMDRIKPDLLKIDVEGAAKEIIKGGYKTLNNISPTIVIELWGGEASDDSIEAVNVLTELGYSAYPLKQEGEIDKISDEKLKSKLKRGSSWDNYVFKVN